MRLKESLAAAGDGADERSSVARRFVCLLHWNGPECRAVEQQSGAKPAGGDTVG
jgi:hypothetical protein